MAPSEGMLPIHSAQPREPISKAEYRQTVRSHSRRRLRRLIKAQANHGGRRVEACFGAASPGMVLEQPGQPHRVRDGHIPLQQALN